MSAHANSAAALQGEQTRGRLGARAAAILAQAEAWPDPRGFTDREMRTALGLGDMNGVRPRITELVEAGYLREVGAATDPLTGKTVRRCRAVTAADRAAAMERRSRARAAGATQLSLFPSR